jgi:hypothetical protein
VSNEQTNEPTPAERRKAIKELADKFHDLATPHDIPTVLSAAFSMLLQAAMWMDPQDRQAMLRGLASVGNAIAAMGDAEGEAAAAAARQAGNGVVFTDDDNQDGTRMAAPSTVQ